jgi:uncharacterized Tic20 family protein
MNDALHPTLSDEACKTASLLHLSALVGLLGNGIGFLLGPLIVWFLKRDEDPFIDEHGKEAVNFQLSMFLAAIVSAVLIIVLIGFVLLAIVGIAMVVFPIIAAMKARNGEVYRYPATIRFIK